MGHVMGHLRYSWYDKHGFEADEAAPTARLSMESMGNDETSRPRLRMRLACVAAPPNRRLSVA